MFLRIKLEEMDDGTHHYSQSKFPCMPGARAISGKSELQCRGSNLRPGRFRCTFDSWLVNSCQMGNGLEWWTLTMKPHQDEQERSVSQQSEDELAHPSLLREDCVDLLVDGG